MTSSPKKGGVKVAKTGRIKGKRQREERKGKGRKGQTKEKNQKGKGRKAAFQGETKGRNA